MSDHAIKVESLGKCYRIRKQSEGRYLTLRDRLATVFKRGATDQHREDFWALKDVSFDLPKGEVLGVIGRNGSGKSTLLKLISRITEPTTGRITSQGRVASLLEVGTGFHPELTGRENIYLNGAIMGMKKAEITATFDEIVAFAEVDQFLDTPVKHYSSGMYVRLAFAVAAHLEPEILIVDEVLAVGDAAFQAKCLGKMNDVAQQSGRTVLFVSHNLSAVRRLCSSILHLEKGTLRHHSNDVETVLDQYKKTWDQSFSDLAAQRDLSHAPRDKGEYIVAKTVSLHNSKGAPVAFFDPGDELTISTTLDFGSLSFEQLDVSFFVSNDQEERVATCFRADTATEPLPNSGRFTCRCCIPNLCLSSGNYWIGIGISSQGVAVDKINHAIQFRMENATLPRPGLLQVVARWTIETKA